MTTFMSDPVEKLKDVADAASEPVETVKDLAAEADRGRSARTPAIALSGVTIAVALAVAVVLAIVIVAYVLA